MKTTKKLYTTNQHIDDVVVKHLIEDHMRKEKSDFLYGTIVSKLQTTDKELNFLLVGLPQSGKSSLLSKLKTQILSKFKLGFTAEFHAKDNGMNVDKITGGVGDRSVNIHAFDSDKLATFEKHFAGVLGRVHGVIMIVDSCAQAELETNKRLLLTLLEKVPENTVVLVFASKQDKQQALPPMKLVKGIGLPQLPKGRIWSLQGICCYMKFDGIAEGLEWFVNEVFKVQFKHRHSDETEAESDQNTIVQEPNYNAYIEHQDFDTYRVAMRMCYNRRKERSKSTQFGQLPDTKHYQTQEQIFELQEAQNKVYNKYKHYLDHQFDNPRDRQLVMHTTKGKYLSEIGVTKKSLQKINHFNPARDLQRRRVLSASNMRGMTPEETLMLHLQQTRPQTGKRSNNLTDQVSTKFGGSVKIEQVDSEPAVKQQHRRMQSCLPGARQLETNSKAQNSSRSQDSESPLKPDPQKHINRAGSQHTVLSPSKTSELQSRFADSQHGKPRNDPAKKVYEARCRRIMQADAKVSNFTQMLFKSQRENDNYGLEIKPHTQTHGSRILSNLPLDHLIDREKQPIVDPETNSHVAKVAFLMEIHYLLCRMGDFEKAQEWIPLSNCASLIACLCLKVDEVLLAMKTYSLCGEMLLIQNQEQYALQMYTKLLNAAYKIEVPHAEYKLFAYKQIAYCYLCMQKYDLALKALKRELQLAWVVNNYTAEIQIYDMMSVCYFYKGDLKKGGYYAQRFMRGVSEASFSRVRKISVLQSKDTQFYAKKPTKDFHLPESLFCQHINNYTFDSELMQKMLKEINEVSADEHKFTSALFDPGSHFLPQQSPIQSPRGVKKLKRDLPSPSNVQSNKNALLLNNLQELKKKEYLQRLETLEKERQAERKRLIQQFGEEKAMKIPESELLKHDPDLDEIAKITVIVEDEHNQQKGGPVVAQHYNKILQRLKLSDLKNAYFVNEMLSAKDKAEIQRKKVSTSIKDIKERAQKFKNTTKNPDKLWLTHQNRAASQTKSSKKIGPAQKYGGRFEQSVAFQIQEDLLSFKNELLRECKNIYLCEEGARVLLTGEEMKIANSTELKYYSKCQIKEESEEYGGEGEESEEEEDDSDVERRGKVRKNVSVVGGVEV